MPKRNPTRAMFKRILRDRIREAVDCACSCGLRGIERERYARSMADATANELYKALVAP